MEIHSHPDVHRVFFAHACSGFWVRTATVFLSHGFPCRVTVSQQDPVIINDVLHDADTSSLDDDGYHDNRHKVLRPHHSRGLRSDLLRRELVASEARGSPVYEEIRGRRLVNGHADSRSRSPEKHYSPAHTGVGGSPSSFVNRDVSPGSGGFTMVVQDRQSRARSLSPNSESSSFRTIPQTHIRSQVPQNSGIYSQTPVYTRTTNSVDIPLEDLDDKKSDSNRSSSLDRQRMVDLRRDRSPPKTSPAVS